MADRSELVIALARTFLHFVRDVAPTSKRAFFRYDFSEARYGSTASFDFGSEATLIDPFEHRSFYSEMNVISERLVAILGKARGVFLLRVDSAFDYDIQFEYENMLRWRISKIEGSGLPEGLT